MVSTHFYIFKGYDLNVPCDIWLVISLGLHLLLTNIFRTFSESLHKNYLSKTEETGPRHNFEKFKGRNCKMHCGIQLVNEVGLKYIFTNGSRKLIEDWIKFFKLESGI